MCKFSGHAKESACSIGITKADASEITSHVFDGIFQNRRQTDLPFGSNRRNLNVDK